jgi:hypothetical protein
MQIIRAMKYYITVHVKGTQFAVHEDEALKNQNLYTIFGSTNAFKTCELNLLGAALMITDLIDMALDHLCQHAPASYDTRNTADMISKADETREMVYKGMTPDEARDAVKLQLRNLKIGLNSSLRGNGTTLEQQLTQ